MAKVCDVPECIAKRMLAEFGWMYNSVSSGAVQLCRLPVVKDNKTALCEVCYCLSEEEFKNILLCISEDMAKEIEKIVVFCEGPSPKKVKGVGKVDALYGEVIDMSTYEQYIACFHPTVNQGIPVNLLTAPFCEEVIQFVIAAVLFVRQHGNAGDRLEVLCRLFSRNVKGISSTKEKEEVSDFLKEAFKQDAFIIVTDNAVGAALYEIFQNLADYITKTGHGDPIGYKRQLNVYLRHLHKDQCDGFHPLALAS